MRNETVSRIYRETVGSFNGHRVDRQEAFEQATATIQNEIRAGRFVLDEVKAIRRELQHADETDGRNADLILARAARGLVDLTREDLDVVVTLGKGMRRQWHDVTTDDLADMYYLRYENFKAQRDAFDTFATDYNSIRPVLFQFQTFGAAFEAGGFPPAASASAAA